MSIDMFAHAHASADTDSERSAIHHTLGEGPNQAAQGNHNHNDDYYTKSQVDATFMDANEVNAALANYYTKTQTDTALAGYYTKNQADTAIKTAVGAYATSQYAPLTIAQVITASTDLLLTGSSLTIVSSGTSDVWEVGYDCEVIQNSTTATLLVSVRLDGAVSNNTVSRFVIPTATSRLNGGKTKYFTGLAAGSHTIDLVARLNGTGNWTVDGVQSSIRAQKIAG